MRVQQNLKKT